jgi:hypothetical protein
MSLLLGRGHGYTGRGLMRIKEKYGMSALLSEADMHGEGKTCRAQPRLRDACSHAGAAIRSRCATRDSWKDTPGAPRTCGAESGRRAAAVREPVPDIAKHTELLLFWGCDRRRRRRLRRLYVQPMSTGLHSIGIKFVYVGTRRSTIRASVRPTNGFPSCRTPTPRFIWPSPTFG